MQKVQFMNPLKSAFNVFSGKFFMFIFYRKQLTWTLPNQGYPRHGASHCDQLRSFMRRVSYLQRSIPTLAELLEPFLQIDREASAIWMGRGSVSSLVDHGFICQGFASGSLFDIQ